MCIPTLSPVVANLKSDKLYFGICCVCCCIWTCVWAFCGFTFFTFIFAGFTVFGVEDSVLVGAVIVVAVFVGLVGIDSVFAFIFLDKSPHMLLSVMLPLTP